VSAKSNAKQSNPRLNERMHVGHLFLNK